MKKDVFLGMEMEQQAASIVLICKAGINSRLRADRPVR